MPDEESKNSNSSGDMGMLITALNRLTDQYEAHKKQQDVENHKKARREWVTIVGIFLAAGVALSQWWVFKEANKDNRTATQAVQRAFMFVRGVSLQKITDVRLTHDVTGTKPVAWQAVTEWENSGNTPTKDLS